MFLPTTKNEIQNLGWDSPDIILVTGDSYIDSPFIGISVIGQYLMNAGYRVAVIAQPDVHSDQDITRLGEPRLFWGISGGCVDSMIANYTALRKRRKSDDFTPGGSNNRRPDRAVIVYCNLIRQWFKNTVPIVLGGIEASLRRIAHYDYWSDQIRKSILFDAKADILVYGMGEKAVLQLADHLKQGRDYRSIRGLCTISKEIPEGYIQLPDFEKVVQEKSAFIEMFNLFYQNTDPVNAKGLVQQHGSRYLVQNPPAEYPSQAELDKIYNPDFERAQHPFYERLGKVKALETIKFSITSHRGCYGECNFCAITVHQGRTIRWRSIKSIAAEVRKLATYPDFKGYILDVGGPTANMYGFECDKKRRKGACKTNRCLFPKVCSSLNVNHEPQIRLLQKIQELPGVKKVFVASGLRYDLILADQKHGLNYLRQLIQNHTSGQLKIAPEHSENRLLQLMGKPGIQVLVKFKKLFQKFVKSSAEKKYLTYYLIAAHPGCRTQEMQQLKKFASRELKIHPKQVQIYIPAPSTYSSVMYYTETNPFTGEKLFVEKDLRQKAYQKQIVTKSTVTKNDRSRR